MTSKYNCSHSFKTVLVTILHLLKPRLPVQHFYSHCQDTLLFHVTGIVKIELMACVDCNRSDYQPEANSTARSRRLRAVVVVEGCQSDLSHSTQGVIVFITPKVNRSLTFLVYLCILGPFKVSEFVAVAVRYNNSLVRKQMKVFSPLLLVSVQIVNIPISSE